VASSDLYNQVLADVNGNGRAQPGVEPDGPARAASDAFRSPEDTAPASDSEPVDRPSADEPWHGHRRLIRATLPRTENEPSVPRPIPEFTMHQRQPARNGRGFRFRGQGGPSGPGNGQPHGFGPGRSGNGNGNADGNVGGNGGGKSGRHRRRRSR
jgi:hypothetical protein